MQVFIKKLNESVTIPDYDKMPESSQKGVVQYGAQQYISDGAASVSLTVKDENGKSVRNPEYPDTPEGNAKYRVDARAGCMARVDKIANGTMGVRGGVDTLATFAAKHKMTVEELEKLLESTPVGKRKAA